MGTRVGLGPQRAWESHGLHIRMLRWALGRASILLTLCICVSASWWFVSGFFFLLRCFRKHLKDWRSWAEGWDRVMLQPVLGFGLPLGWVVPRERSGPLCAHPYASSLAAGYLEQKRDAKLLGMAWTPWHMQWVEAQGERGHHGTLVEGWCESPWLSVTSPLVRNA